MKRFLCAVFTIVIVVVLASCTARDINTTTLATTTSSWEDNITTTAISTTTVRNEQSTTEISNVSSTTITTTTNTTITDIVTTTTKNSGSGVVFYAQYPDIPDYGALVGVSYAKFEKNVFYYRMDIVAQKDPDGNSGSRYMKLLENCGYVAVAPYDKDGVKGYLYGNSTTGSMVLFGAAPENGAIVVAIPQQ